MFTKTLKLEQTSVNGLDTQRKVEGASRVVLGDCGGGVGRSPRLGGVAGKVPAGSEHAALSNA